MRRDRRAMAMALILLAVLVLAVIGMAFMELTRTRYGLSYKAVHYNRAYYLAEAGLYWSVRELDRGGSGNAAPASLPPALSGLTSAYPYRLEVRVSRERGRHRIESRATVGELTVVLEGVRDLSALAILRGKP